MNGIIRKINERLKFQLNLKGQSLVEFALILAFCAGIAWMANEVGFREAIAAVFDNGEHPEYVTAAIGGGGTVPTPPTPPDPPNPPDPPTPPDPTPQEYGAGRGPSGFDWGVIDPNEYYLKEYSNEEAQKDFTKAAAQADRLASDQKALENIGRFFIGKTKEYVMGLMTYDTKTADMGNGLEGQELHLGHFIQADVNDPTSMVFRTDRDLKGKETITIVTETGQKKVSVNNDIFTWMRNPENPENEQYDNDYNYLVSDYVVSQSWADVGGSDQGNGLRLKLEYDYSGKFADNPPGYYENANDVKVIGAQVVIDAKSQNNATVRNDPTIVNDKGIMKYNARSSEGLDVQVRMNDDGEIYVTHFNTAKEITAANHNNSSLNNNVLKNWYGEGYYITTKEYIAGAAEVLTSQSKTYNVKRGDIFKAANNYYWVAVKDVTLDLNQNSPSAYEYSPTKNPDQAYFVKFSGTNTNYRHENEPVYTTVDSKKVASFDSQEHSFAINTIEYRGTVMTMDNGDMYVYVGNDKRENGNQNVPYTGINNTDWIQIRGQREVLDARLKAKAVTKDTDGSYPYGSYTPGAIVNDNGTYKIVINGNETEKWHNTVEYHIIDVAEHYASDGTHLDLKSGDVVLTDNGNAYVYKYNNGWVSYPPDLSDSNWVKIEM